MNQYETFTCDNFLSDYPDQWNFNDIVGLLACEEQGDDIVPWHVFADVGGVVLASYMKLFKNSLERQFLPKE